MVSTIILQICTMFILALCGYAMFRTGKITEEGSKSIGNILIYLSLPCVIIRGFMRERAEGELLLLLVSAIIAFLALLLSTFVSRLIFRRDKIAVFAGAYSNPGFFGIPIITAVAGTEAVFYAAPFIAFLNMFQWTYGVSLLKGGNKPEKISLKKIVTAPFFIAIIIGLILYVTGIQLPSFLTKSIAHIAELNTPLAMFTTGIYLAKSDVIKMVRRLSLYYVSAVRLVVIPVIVGALMLLVPSNLINDTMKLVILIASSCPVGSNVAVYAALYGADSSYAAETVVVSTIISIVTIPLIIFAFTAI